MLSKEFGIFDPNKTIDEDIKNADNFITELTGGGIMVHPKNDSTSGWKIAAALELLKSGVAALKMWLSNGKAVVRIGEENRSRVEIDYHSMQMIAPVSSDPEDGEQVYFHVSDLRDADGKVHAEEYYTGNGSAQAFLMMYDSEDLDYEVTVYDTSDVDVSSSYPCTKMLGYFVFDTAPPSGYTIKVRYVVGQWTGPYLKAFTFGTRSEKKPVGPMSATLGEGLIASGKDEVAVGRFNNPIGPSHFSVGNGSSDSSRSNAMWVDDWGNIHIDGDIVGDADYNKKYADASVGTFTDKDKTSNSSAVTVADQTRVEIANTGSLPAGTYILLGNLTFASNTTGQRYGLILGGSAGSGSFSRAQLASSGCKTDAASSGVAVINCQCIESVSSATTFRLLAYQNSGSSLGVTGRLMAIRVK